MYYSHIVFWVVPCAVAATILIKISSLNLQLHRARKQLAALVSRCPDSPEPIEVQLQPVQVIQAHPPVQAYVAPRYRAADTKEIAIQNNFLSRHVVIEDGHLSSKMLVNKRIDDGLSVTLQPGSEEFVIRLSGSEQAPKQHLDPTGWQITASSSSVEQNGNGPVENLIDGKSDTYWITDNSKGYPHYFQVDMGTGTSFRCFGYLPRQDAPPNQYGAVVNYQLLIGDDENSLRVVSQGALHHKPDRSEIFVNLPAPVTARYVRMVCICSYESFNRAAGAQFSLYADECVDTSVYIKSSELLVQEWKQETEGGDLRVAFQPITKGDVQYSITLFYQIGKDDHFMKKWLEISVPQEQLKSAFVDYLELDSMLFDVAKTEHWTHPVMPSSDIPTNGYYLSCGQVFYVGGMFVGTEFPMSETEINQEFNRGYTRYYIGKTFQQLQAEEMIDGAVLKTHQAVLGAARSTQMDVQMNDFFSYIKTIEVETPMRTQYNSWFDWMMDIDENNILHSFKEIESGLTHAGLGPLDAYVVDDGWNAYGPWQGENTAGFWQFNSKFPNELDKPKELCDRICSNFGLWLGPRGGYSYNNGFAVFIENHGNGEHNPASSDICVGHKVYCDKLLEFFIDKQKRFNISYWKLDGFAQVPCSKVNEHHANGGYNNMHYMSEMWERWTRMFSKMRQEASSRGCNNFWINLTCYVTPSPFLLKYVNSVWLQVSADLARKNTGLTRQVDQLLTYRDGKHYEFQRTRQFQFPFFHIYNHDPVYGKTNTNLENTMTDDEFRCYLYMIISRGTALQNLYYSYTMINEGQKWAITVEALKWKKENIHILKNSMLYGENPNDGGVYFYSAWNQSEGIIAIRNSAANEQTYTITLDKNIGVTEGVQGLYRYTQMYFRSDDVKFQFVTYKYGDTITKTFAPGEAVIWKFTDQRDEEAPVVRSIKTVGHDLVNVEFNKNIQMLNFKAEFDSLSVQGYELLADYKTMQVRTSEMLDKTSYTIYIRTVEDWNGNLNVIELPFVYHDNMEVNKASSVDDVEKSDFVESVEVGKQQLLRIQSHVVSLASESSVTGVSDFQVSFLIQCQQGDRSIIRQGQHYSVQMQQGKISFTVDQQTVLSDEIPAQDQLCFVSCTREKSGMLKIYLNGELSRSTYSGAATYRVKNEQITVGDSQHDLVVGKITVLNRAYTSQEQADLYQRVIE